MNDAWLEQASKVSLCVHVQVCNIILLSMNGYLELCGQVYSITEP